MLLRLLLPLILALLFTLGQQGAIAHSISHLADSQEQQPDKSGHVPVCEKCVTYAKLGHALHAAVFELPVIALAHHDPSRHLFQNHSTHPGFYAARGPPEHS